MKEILPLSSGDFALFQGLIVEACGLHFEEDRKQSLHLALWERLQQRGYDSYREYYNLLKFHPDGRLEISELLDLITIGETYFFRNKAQFNVLVNSVLPEIMKRKSGSQGKSIRVWSAGCSRGDEPYSIAIAIREVLPSDQKWTLSILGTDINRNGLARAKEATYGEKDVAHLPKEYLDKYFKPKGSTYVLNPDVRELVQFEHHNLVKDPFVNEKMQMVDLVFCRNVTIYFDFQTTRRVIENFYNSLVPEGYLFLGHTETLWQITDKFERVEFPQTFIYQKKSSPVREDATKPFIALPEVRIEDLTRSTGSTTLSELSPKGLEDWVSTKEKDTSKSVLQETMSRLQGKSEPLQQAEPSLDRASLPFPDRVIPQDKNRILAYLADATHLANQARYREAADVLTKIIELDNLSVEAYYLLGVLSYKSGNLKEAETQFRKVIYVTPDSALAYFNLGNIYLYQRKFGEAAREFRNAIRLSEKRPQDEQIRFCEDFTVDFLLRACRNNLAEISKRGERHE